MELDSDDEGLKLPEEISLLVNFPDINQSVLELEAALESGDIESLEDALDKVGRSLHFKGQFGALDVQTRHRILNALFRIEGNQIPTDESLQVMFFICNESQFVCREFVEMGGVDYLLARLIHSPSEDAVFYVSRCLLYLLESHSEIRILMSEYLVMEKILLLCETQPTYPLLKVFGKFLQELATLFLKRDPSDTSLGILFAIKDNSPAMNLMVYFLHSEFEEIAYYGLVAFAVVVGETGELESFGVLERLGTLTQSTDQIFRNQILLLLERVDIRKLSAVCLSFFWRLSLQTLIEGDQENITLALCSLDDLILYHPTLLTENQGDIDVDLVLEFIQHPSHKVKRAAAWLLTRIFRQCQNIMEFPFVIEGVINVIESGDEKLAHLFCTSLAEQFDINPGEEITRVLECFVSLGGMDALRNLAEDYPNCAQLHALVELLIP